MKKRFEYQMAIDGWFSAIVAVLLLIALAVLRFLKVYILKALDLIVTLFVAWLIIYIIFHPTIKASISITGGLL